MEPLWSPVVATGGNRSQVSRPRKRLNQAKTVAADCDQLPFEAHGKQGVGRGLTAVAGGRLPAKEGVDAYLARLCAPISSCNPGRGTGRSRSRCMPGGSWRDGPVRPKSGPVVVEKDLGDAGGLFQGGEVSGLSK